MTTQQYLEQWHGAGAITPAQFELLSALTSRRRFSLFAELNALLYLGVLSFTIGLGLTIYRYSANLGDYAIIAALTFAFAGALYYCFSRARPFSRSHVEPTGFAFDYVLYLGCLTFAVELGYIEFRFHPLQQNWDYYLLASSILYFALAYRFDNRLVLSLALSTLAGWFGLRLWQFQPTPQALRRDAIVYGATVAAAGLALYRADIKKHLLDAYLHVAVNVMFIALLSAVLDGPRSWFNDLFVVGLAAVSVAGGLRFKRFAFVAYGVLYGYVGVTARALNALRIQSFSDVMAYFVVTATLVVALLVFLARQFGRGE